MNLEQAQLIRSKLLYLEGLIAKETREYIWKVLIGPLESDAMTRFAASIDPGRPLKAEALIKRLTSSDVSVYFFLKKDGEILYRNWEQFLFFNNIQTNIDFPEPARAFTGILG